MPAKKGDRVKIEYTGSLDDGSVFDTSREDVAREAGCYDPDREYGPIEFVVGSGEIIPGIDEAVEGMEPGEKKSIDIPPEKAYGPRMEELVKEIPMEAMRSGDGSAPKPEVGMFVRGVSPMGMPMIGRIVDVGEESVRVDFNHPLAGKTLHFEIELVAIESPE